MNKALKCLTLAVALLSLPVGALAQGVGAGRVAQGEDEKRFPLDLEDGSESAGEWHERGEALEREGKREQARKAFAEAVKLHLIAYRRVTNASPRRPTPEWTAEEKAGLRRAAARRLERASESARRYLLLGEPESELERENLEAIRAHAALLAETDEARAAFFPFEVDEKARVTYKPEPGYTERARANGTGGRVMVRAVLTADGEVRHVLVMKGLPDGLSERAVEAARSMRFEPARRAGRPVSQLITLEYSFQIQMRRFRY